MSDDAIAEQGLPRQPRSSVLLSAVVEQFGGGAPTTHRVRDLSPGGVRIDKAVGFRKGATVLVTVGALQSVAATVVWVRDGVAGLKFANEIEPDDARAKAAIGSHATARGEPNSSGTVPTAGWIRDLNDPYRN
jgi:hypothetical protein